MSYTTAEAREEFARSGEDWLLQVLSSKTAKIDTIFDVGCNCGEWTRMAREFFPGANLHAFEIIPEVYRKFINSQEINQQIVANNFGLGSKIGTILMKYCTANDRYSTSLIKLSPGTVANIPFVWRDCLTVTGDAYVKMHNINYIDFLKLDVEGAENSVLEGFSEMLKNKNIGMIQFEYGIANIASKWLLMDAYELLTPLGFRLGKLGPGGVKFKGYQFSDETFLAPNIVAVHSSRTDILGSLT